MYFDILAGLFYILDRRPDKRQVPTPDFQRQVFTVTVYTVRYSGHSKLRNGGNEVLMASCGGVPMTVK